MNLELFIYFVLLRVLGFLHRTYQGVLPPWVTLAFVSVALWANIALPGVEVPLWAGVVGRSGLPVLVHSPSCGFIVVAPSASGAGRRRDILPHCCTVLLSCAGRRGMVALVAGCLMVARVGGLFSWHWSGVGGVIIWIPPEREMYTGRCNTGLNWFEGEDVPEIWPSCYSVYMARLWPWQDRVVLGGLWMERCQEITANALVSIYEAVCVFSWSV